MADNPSTYQYFINTGYKPTRTDIRIYSEPSGYIESDCFQITFINKGAVNCRVNNFPMMPGESLSIACDYPQFDCSKYKYDFDNLPGDKRLYVIKKIPGML